VFPKRLIKEKAEVRQSQRSVPPFPHRGAPFTLPSRLPNPCCHTPFNQCACRNTSPSVHW
jgi:hypothetical protein